MVQIEVRGKRQLRNLDRALAGASKQMKRRTTVALNKTVRPLGQAVKDEAPDYLPDPYADELAQSLRITTRRRGDSLTLKATAKTRDGKPRQLGQLERGSLRHPAWGRWVPGIPTQRVRPGFWTKPLLSKAPVVRKELVKVLKDLANTVARSV